MTRGVIFIFPNFQRKHSGVVHFSAETVFQEILNQIIYPKKIIVPFNMKDE